jgi:hypothetical protein
MLSNLVMVFRLFENTNIGSSIKTSEQVAGNEREGMQILPGPPGPRRGPFQIGLWPLALPAPARISPAPATEQKQHDDNDQYSIHNLSFISVLYS